MNREKIKNRKNRKGKIKKENGSLREMYYKNRGMKWVKKIWRRWNWNRVLKKKV